MKVKERILILVVISLLFLGFTTKAMASSVTGRPIDVTDQGNGVYDVGLDTGERDGTVDWARTLEGVSTTDGQLLMDAKNEEFDVTITYHVKWVGTTAHFICDSVKRTTGGVTAYITINGILYMRDPRTGELIPCGEQQIE